MEKMDKPKTVYVTYIVTTPEKLWEALTRPESTRQYFFGRAVESDWKVGSPFAYRMEDGGIDVKGKVLESDPPRRLAVTWEVEWREGLPEPFTPELLRSLPETVVTFEIEPLGEVVRLTMTESHAGPIDDKLLEGGRRGWPVILSGLKSLLETGRPLPKLEASARG